MVEVSERVIPLSVVADLLVHQEYDLLKKFEETLADLRVFISAVRLPGIIEAEQVDNVGQHIVENPAGILPVGKRIEFFAKALELRGQLNLAMTHLLSCQSDFAAFYEPAVTPQLDGAEFEALM